MSRMINVCITNEEGCRENHDLPASWVICPNCGGDGHHSKHLGAYSREEFDREFSPEEQEDYFNGVYNRTCEACHGSGKVLDVDETRLTPSQKPIFDCWREERAEAAREAAADRRLYMMESGIWEPGY